MFFYLIAIPFSYSKNFSSSTFSMGYLIEEKMNSSPNDIGNSNYAIKQPQTPRIMVGNEPCYFPSFEELKNKTYVELLSDTKAQTAMKLANALG